MKTSAAPESHTDTVLISSLLTWEGLFGQRPLSWVEIQDAGSGLNPEEAALFLNNQIRDKKRAALYGDLLRNHPELENFARCHHLECNLRCHYVAKLSPSVAPPPKEELDYLVRESKTAGYAWLATRVAGNQWETPHPGQEAIAIIFYVRDDGNLDSVVASIKRHRTRMPQEDAVSQFYGPKPQFDGWWQLSQVIRVNFPSLAGIPGRSLKGKLPKDCFAARATFAYWTFDQPITSHLFHRWLKAQFPQCSELNTKEPTRSLSPS